MLRDALQSAQELAWSRRAKLVKATGKVIDEDIPSSDHWLKRAGYSAAIVLAGLLIGNPLRTR